MATTSKVFTGTCTVTVSGTAATITRASLIDADGNAVSSFVNRIKATDIFVTPSGIGVVSAVSDASTLVCDPWFGAASATAVPFRSLPIPAGSETLANVNSLLALYRELQDIPFARTSDATAFDALIKIDCLSALCLESTTLTAPPASPSEGQTWLVAANATGAWSGYSGRIAYFIGGEWRFYTPFNGLRAYVVTTGQLNVYLSGSWTAISSTDFVTKTGVQTLTGKTFSGTTAFPGGTTIRSDGLMNVGSPPLTIGQLNVGGSITAQATTNGEGTHPVIGVCTTRPGGIKRGDELGALVSMSNTSTNTLMGHCAYIQFWASGDHTDTSTPTNMIFQCGIPGSADGVKFMYSDDSANLVVPVGFQCGKFYVNAASGRAGFNTTNPTTGWFEFDGYSTVNVPNFIVFKTRNLSSANFQLGIYDSGSGGMGFRWINESNNTLICTDGWGNTGIGTSNTDGRNARLVVAGNLIPNTNNSCSLGNSSYCWSNGYIQNAWTVVSDERLKDEIANLAEAEMAVAKEIAPLVSLFKMKSAIAEKGAAQARKHCGWIAQQIEETFVAHGLDPFAYGCVGYDLATKSVTKTRTITRQKTQTVAVEPTGGSYEDRDGVAVFVPSTTAGTREELVWTNERDLPFVDADGKPVMEKIGNNADGSPIMRQKMVHLADPVMETVEEPYDEQVPDTDENGEQRKIHNVRMEELTAFALAGLAARVVALEAAKAS